MKRRTCIGFGEMERRCTNKAGSPWSKLWCPDCDKRRLDHITKQFDRILKGWPVGGNPA